MKKTQEHIFDELLVLQHQAGHKKAMPLLVKRWYRKMLLHSCRFTKNMEASKDIVQECWMVIINKLSTLKDPSYFGVWTLSIVSKKSVDWIRKQQKVRNHKEEFLKSQDQNNEMEDNSRSKITALKLEILKLPEKQQLVLKMFYVENYSISEIGSILSTSSGTVKSRLFNAREQLKKYIT